MRIKMGVVGSLLAVTSICAKADELTLFPSIGLGISGMNFSRSTGETDEARFKIVDITLTASYKGFFIRGNMETPLGDAITYGPALVRQFNREDSAITLGWFPFETFHIADNYPAIRNFSLFTGYSYSKTGIITYDGGSGLLPYAVYTEHLDKGWFYGIGYALNVADSGTFSLSAAYASLDGSQVVQPSAPGFVASTENGTTSGLSYGLSWSSTLKGKVTYYASWRHRSYTTDLVTISIDKQFSILSLGFVFPL